MYFKFFHHCKDTIFLDEKYKKVVKTYTAVGVISCV
nr:MAG TPA: hypothetical protein [Caudoviricetes sp.]